ncbi:AAA family ATPase [Bosea sp. BH3]|uniref:bifunctional aminoglycoside phosphotransferase/ATP-binding protein n=1 Tax=Bosea sp. BH3 TaxID=2871701 RepID=UPI0021CB2126|nr:bifunctional aminoglycoside phosphotransferase/ATP-binding protein [Bosea sp. BH3]MCU4178208.1 AAA family ATPase [Bosea sp. BH3]
MQASDQNETICFLGSPQAFGAERETAKIVSTHISTVLLLGARALKLKRAVRLPYIDLSTPELRLAMCERELKLNRRTAPQIYRAVHRITRGHNGSLALNGEGELVDAALEMQRFDDEQLFDKQAQLQRLTPADMAGLAAALAELHGVAAVSTDAHGAGRVERVLDVNERAFAAADLLPVEDVEHINAVCRATLARHAELLDRRARDGKVRRGHGDLHLRNICRIDGKPLLFDCLEFDEDLATTDILYDLAFVLMDLWRRGLAALANILFNRYLDATGDEAGLRLLPFFMAIRAVVRAHVTAADSGRPELERVAEAQAYLRLAHDLLAARRPMLVAVGGYSGSGKSTVAAAIAPALGPAPGARIAASDRIRKRLCGVSPETRLPQEGYSDEVSGRTYAEMAVIAGNALAQGHAAIADAVFDRRSERERIEAVALAAGVPFRGLWLEAPEQVLVERVSARRGDPSDATPDIVRSQLARQGDPSDWTRLPSRMEPGLVVTAALAAIGRPADRRVLVPSV